MLTLSVARNVDQKLTCLVIVGSHASLRSVMHFLWSVWTLDDIFSHTPTAREFMELTCVAVPLIHPHIIVQDTIHLAMRVKKLFVAEYRYNRHPFGVSAVLSVFQHTTLEDSQVDREIHLSWWHIGDRINRCKTFGKFRAGIVTSETSWYPAETSKMLFHETKSYLHGSCDITEEHSSNRRQGLSHPKSFHTYQNHPVIIFSGSYQLLFMVSLEFVNSMLAPLYQLLHWHWKQEQQKAFEKPKATSWQLLS